MPEASGLDEETTPFRKPLIRKSTYWKLRGDAYLHSLISLDECKDMFQKSASSVKQQTKMAIPDQ